MYKYSAFGLQIASDFDFPNLLPGKDAPVEVYILKAKAQNDFPPEGFSFQVPGVGRFNVSEGRRIIVDPLRPSSSAFKLYVLGTAFGVLLFQRGFLPIHGSAFLIDKKCIVLTGASGAGKSTLSVAFRKHGCLFLTDDVAPLKIEKDGPILVYPGYPQQKLWQDSAEILLEGKTKELVRIEGIRDKYYLPAAESFCNQPAELSAIIELVPSDVEQVGKETLSKHDGLLTLIANTYRLEVVPCLGLTQNHFAQCAAVADCKPIFRVARPHSLFTVDEQTKIILQIVDLI